MGIRQVKAKEEEIILGLLTAVERDSRASQRELARDLGIALGLTNAYLKRCLRKGFVKITQAPANRYLYYLTPGGLTEKARLTGEYLTQSFDFVRQARSQCTATLAAMAESGVRRAALAGASELAEIMALCAGMQKAVTLVGIIDPHCRESSLAGLPIVSHGDKLPDHDGVLVTALTDAPAVWAAQAARVGEDRVLAPALLGLGRKAPAAQVFNDISPALG